MALRRVAKNRRAQHYEKVHRIEVTGREAHRVKQLRDESHHFDVLGLIDIAQVLILLWWPQLRKLCSLLDQRHSLLLSALSRTRNQGMFCLI